MNFLLITTCIAVLVAGVCSKSSGETSHELLSAKEEIRFELKHLLERYNGVGMESFCPRGISPEQIVFGNQAIQEFVECANATIDIFVDKLDDDLNFVKSDNISQVVRKYAAPVCEVLDDMFRCIAIISPAIDLCLNPREQVFKNKVFKIVPLIQQTICLRNGDLIADIVEHDDGMKCFMNVTDTMVDFGLIELFESNTNELFGDEKVCQGFNMLLRQVYLLLGECSLPVLEIVKDMLGFFCDGTHCDRFVHDLQCY